MAGWRQDKQNEKQGNERSDVLTGREEQTKEEMAHAGLALTYISRIVPDWSRHPG